MKHKGIDYKTYAVQYYLNNNESMVYRTNKKTEYSRNLSTWKQKLYKDV